MSEYQKNLHDWLRSNQVAAALDRACSQVLSAGLSGLSQTEFIAADSSVKRLYAVDSGSGYVPGSDCDYSCKGVGEFYTCHWHCKRVHDALAFLVPLAESLSKAQYSVTDIGAGTSAVLWAWALIAVHRHRTGRHVFVHDWWNVDSSLEMLGQGDRLWAAFCSVFPDAASLVQRTNVPESFLSVDTNVLPKNGVVVGGFPFSRQDVANANSTSAALARLVVVSNPVAVCIWTKPNKSAVLTKLKSRLLGYTDRQLPARYRSPFRGALGNCQQAVRSEYVRRNLAVDEVGLSNFGWGGAATNAFGVLMTRK